MAEEDWYDKLIRRLNEAYEAQVAAAQRRQRIRKFAIPIVAIVVSLLALTAFFSPSTLGSLQNIYSGKPTGNTYAVLDEFAFYEEVRHNNQTHAADELRKAKKIQELIELLEKWAEEHKSLRVSDLALSRKHHKTIDEVSHQAQSDLMTAKEHLSSAERHRQSLIETTKQSILDSHEAWKALHYKHHTDHRALEVQYADAVKAHDTCRTARMLNCHKEEKAMYAAADSFFAREHHSVEQHLNHLNVQLYRKFHVAAKLLEQSYAAARSATTHMQEALVTYKEQLLHYHFQDMSVFTKALRAFTVDTKYDAYTLEARKCAVQLTAFIKNAEYITAIIDDREVEVSTYAHDIERIWMELNRLSVTQFPAGLLTYDVCWAQMTCHERFMSVIRRYHELSFQAPATPLIAAA